MGHVASGGLQYSPTQGDRSGRPERQRGEPPVPRSAVGCELPAAASTAGLSVVCHRHAHREGRVLAILYQFQGRGPGPERDRYTFNNFVPQQFTISAEAAHAGPHQHDRHLRSGFLEDQSADAAGGVRYDHLHSFFDDQVVGPVKFLPSVINLAATDGASVHDITPRMAATTI